MNVIEQNLRIIGSFLPNVIGALLILIIGWIVAAIVSGVVKGMLRRTDLDNRIARSMGGTGIGVERAIGSVVFWLIMLFVLVGFFQALDLPVVSQPLTQLLTTVLAFLPRILSAAVLLLLAWVLATVLKRLVTRVLGGMGIDRRLSRMVRDEEPAAAPAGSTTTATATETAEGSTAAPSGGGVSLSNTLGEVVYIRQDLARPADHRPGCCARVRRLRAT